MTASNADDPKGNDDVPFASSLFNGFRDSLKEFDPESEGIKNIFYYPARNCCLVKIPSGRYVELRGPDIRLKLRQMGISNVKDALTGLSHVDDAKMHIINYRSLDHVGPLAGYMCGYYEMCGNHILVNSEARVFPIEEGDSEVFLSFLMGLMPDEEKGFMTFLWWLRGIILEPDKPAQALVLAGPPGCGKTLLQKVITEILGGRSANPYQWMSGKSNFSSDVFGAEHLMISDEPSSADDRVRDRMGCAIKSIVVNSEHRCHAKNKDAITLQPKWVLSISANEDPGSLQILPSIDENNEDKLIMLSVVKSPFSMGTETDEEQKAFFNALCDGASALLYDLAKEEVPAEYTDPRYVVPFYHSPGILRALGAISSEGQLLELIDEHVRLPYTGSAAKLDGQLRRSASRQIEKLFSYNGACSMMLGKLAKQYPERIEKFRTKEQRGWHIQCHPAEGDPDTRVTPPAERKPE